MLIYFILGILFITLGIPILQAFSSIVSAWAQYVVYIFALKIYNIKQRMEKEEQEEESNPIGFQVEAIGDQIQFIEQEQE